MEAARVEVPAVPEKIEEPTPMGRVYFRTLVAQYARRDTVADLYAGFWGRWKLLRAILKFTSGKGDVPPLQTEFKSVPFATLENPFGPIEPDVDEILTRYFRVKIQGIHFCGSAFYNVPFTEGFHSLALMLPVTLWLARWLAAGAGRTRLTVDDVSKALTIADHHHGYSPAFGHPASRNRVRQLAQIGDISRLCWWYSR
jgi:lysine-N-methylase